MSVRVTERERTNERTNANELSANQWERVTDDYERRRRRSRDETRRDDDDDDANGDATDGERRYGSTALGISGDDDDGG